MRMRQEAKRRNRKGVAVLEIMVGMMILAIGLLGTAGMTVAAARRGTGLSTASSRDGIILQELYKLATMPYDSLTPRAGCSTTTSDALSYTRCISVTDISTGAGYKRVQLIITPTGSWARADTAYLNRVRGAIAMNPFGS